MKEKRGKLIFGAIIVGLVAIMAFSMLGIAKKKGSNQDYRFDFEDESELDDFWLVSEFGSFSEDRSLFSLKDGTLVLYSAESGRMPMLISKPIDLPPGSVIKIKRRVRVTHGSDVFAGGMAIYQTDDDNLTPRPDRSSWYNSLGDGMVLIEYSRDLVHQESRPGKDVFRLLAADWSVTGNYEIYAPIYDEWFVEELEYDTRTNMLRYKLNGDASTFYTYSMDKPAVRIVMHSYGEDNNSKIEIDYIEITVINKNTKVRDRRK